MLSNALRAQPTACGRLASNASLLARRAAFSTSSVARMNMDNTRTVYMCKVANFRYETMRDVLKERGFNVSRIRRGGRSYGHIELATAEEATRMLQLHSEDPIIYSTRPVQMERVTLKVGEPFPVLRLRGLPLDATPAQIAALFEVSESKVTFVEVDTALVETESTERATEILEASKSEPKSLAGHTLMLSYAKASLFPPSVDLHISMSTPALSVDEIRTIFSEVDPSVSNIQHLPDDPTKAWVTFATVEAATAAREALNAKTFGTTKLILNYALHHPSKKTPPSLPSAEGHVSDN